MTSYSTVYNAFLRRVEDVDLVNFSDETVAELLLGWLTDALAYIDMDGFRVRNDFSNRDDEALTFNVTLHPTEIVLISMYMVVAWYDPKINSLDHTLSMWGSTDEKWTNQMQHLNETRKSREYYRKQAKDFFVNYGYHNNDYIG